jgi:RNA polymerase sigma-70 factor (ECF subfamily)
VIKSLLLGGLADHQVKYDSKTDDAQCSVLFECLVDEHYRHIYNFIYHMVQNEQDAADLTQETFIRIYRALPKMRKHGALPAWIRRIALNLCFDHLRKRNSNPTPLSLDIDPDDDNYQGAPLQIADPSDEPDKIFDKEEGSRILRRTIGNLPDEYRTVILLHYLEEQRIEEIAELLQEPEGTIKSRLSRARKELHRRLAPYFEP